MPGTAQWLYILNVKKGRRYYPHFEDEEIEIYKGICRYQKAVMIQTQRSADSQDLFILRYLLPYLPGFFRYFVYCTVVGVFSVLPPNPLY